ncbi:MAG: REP-associated tyrosine transposase [Phycisphaerales bacterium JB059]
MAEPRKKLRRYEIKGHARFLTFSCNQRLALFENPAIRDTFAEQVFLARSRLGFKLFAWVIMPEHVHLLVLPLESTVPSILSATKRPFSALVLQRWRELEAPVLERIRDGSGAERFWQAGGGYDRNIFSEGELREKIRYIHENPVRRGLVEREEDWAWSSARAMRGLETRWPTIDRA